MENFPTIQPTEKKVNGAWKFPQLFRETATGKKAVWQIGFDGLDHLIMLFGQVGGKMRTTEAEVKPKVKRSMDEQALQEASQRYNEKIRKEGYRPENEEEVENEEEPEGEFEGFKQPMLANKWVPGKTKLKFPILTQPKLDGIRALAFNDDGQIRFRSRNGKEFFFLNHIRKALVKLFKFLPKGAILDGEFYNLILTFNQITSIVRQLKNPSPQEEELAYCIFDIILPDNPPFDTRFKILEQDYNKYIASLTEDEDNPTCLVEVNEANSEDELLDQHDEYVKMGYEGLIIRKIAGKNPTTADIEAARYKFGRGSSLLKYKEFIDEEGEVVDIKEATGTEKGAAILIIKDARGNLIPVRFRAPIELRREWFKHPEMVIGKMATIRFQELTPEGIPRFPVGIAIRDYE